MDEREAAFKSLQYNVSALEAYQTLQQIYGNLITYCKNVVVSGGTCIVVEIVFVRLSAGPLHESNVRSSWTPSHWWGRTYAWEKSLQRDFCSLVKWSSAFCWGSRHPNISEIPSFRYFLQCTAFAKANIVLYVSAGFLGAQSRWTNDRINTDNQ